MVCHLRKVDRGSEVRFCSERGTVCIHIFVGRIFREHPASNHFRDFNFANSGLQQQSCTISIHIFAFLFLRLPIDFHKNKVPQKLVCIR